MARRKASPSKSKIKVVSSPKGQMMILSEDLGKKTVVELKKIAKAEGAVVKGTGKSGGVLRNDLILAIVDARAKKSGVKKIKVSVARVPSPKKPKTPSPKKPKRPRTPSPSPPPKKKEYTRAELKAMPVSSLRKLCKELGLEGCMEIMESSELASVIRRALKVKKPKRLLRCDEDGKTKCTGKTPVCYTETGSCRKATATGRPYGEAALKKSLRDDYYYDEEFKLVGKKRDVKAHLKYWKKPKAKKVKPPTPPPKVVRPPSPKVVSYGAMRLKELQSICKQRGIEAKKCRLKKTELIAVLEEWDKQAGVEEEEEEIIERRVSPITMPSPLLPPPPPAILRPPKALPRCDALEDPLLCAADEVCSSATGACVKDSADVRRNKWVLTVNGRVIIGDKTTIEKLQQTLGGTISKPKVPETKKEIEKRLAELEVPEEAGIEAELRALKEKERAPEEKEKPTIKKVPTKVPSVKVAASQQEILETFTKCLKDLTPQK